MTEPFALTIKEAVAQSRISHSELYKAIGRGELKAKKRGRRTLILQEDLHTYLRNLPDFDAKAG